MKIAHQSTLLSTTDKLLRKLCHCINVAPRSFTCTNLIFFHIRLASQGQSIRSGAYSRSESILKVLAEELQSEICGAGAPLTSSLTPARVSQLFSGNIPDGVQNPPCPGGPENKRQQKRKTSNTSCCCLDGHIYKKCDRGKHYTL